MKPPVLRSGTKAWADEDHVRASRALYVRKFDIVEEVFRDVPGCGAPEAGFFLWLPVEDGEAAALRLWTQTGVRVLPGAYLSREVDGKNPGAGYIRVALVAAEQEMQRGLIQLRDCLYI
ncbi:hypothetical protein LCGC14_2678570 [marine sediment metagenome]|uniref:Aminotransferase class I/classII domain-containing protein n=1 Tax=marine sediment metagenome TaxID=412755 RepID=A0A0F8ZM11_9ZZZZ